MTDQPKKAALTTLWSKLDKASAQVPADSTWRHYRGDVYEVVGTMIDEHTGEVKVAYKRAFLDDGYREKVIFGKLSQRELSQIVFCRPLSEFLEEIPCLDLGEKNAVESTIPRFRRVEARPSWVDYRGR